MTIDGRKNQKNEETLCFVPFCGRPLHLSCKIEPERQKQGRMPEADWSGQPGTVTF